MATFRKKNLWPTPSLCRRHPPIEAQLLKRNTLKGSLFLHLSKVCQRVPPYPWSFFGHHEGSVSRLPISNNWYTSRIGRLYPRAYGQPVNGIRMPDVQLQFVVANNTYDQCMCFLSPWPCCQIDTKSLLEHKVCPGPTFFEPAAQTHPQSPHIIQVTIKATSVSPRPRAGSALTDVIPSNGESRAKWYSDIMTYFVVSFKADSFSPHAMYPQHGFEHAYIGPNSPGHAKFRPGCTNFEAFQRAGLCCFHENT